MTAPDFYQRQFKLSVVAGMNQRYHQRRASTEWQRDAIAKVVTAIFAVIGLGLSISSAFATHWSVALLSVLASLVAAVSAVVLNVFPFGAWEKEHYDAFRRWTDLREDIDTLGLELGENDPRPEIEARFLQLSAKVHRICASESLPDEKLLDACLLAEEKSRGCDMSAPVPTPARVPA